MVEVVQTLDTQPDASFATLDSKLVVLVVSMMMVMVMMVVVVVTPDVVVVAILVVFTHPLCLYSHRSDL